MSRLNECNVWTEPKRTKPHVMNGQGVNWLQRQLGEVCMAVFQQDYATAEELCRSVKLDFSDGTPRAIGPR